MRRSKTHPSGPSERSAGRSTRRSAPEERGSVGEARHGDASAASLDAGDFSVWLATMGQALEGKRSSAVPCGDCTACCTSSQFVHIGPDETDTLARIPKELLFPAPGLPRDHVLLGYDEQGHCPMLVDGRCSIYEHRPRTCRTYDCRVFPAAGVTADDDKIFIVRQSRRWAFRFPTDAARAEHQAVSAAARFLVEHRDELSGASAPANATQLAVAALQVHRVFLAEDAASGRTTNVEPAAEVVVAELARATARLRTARGAGGKPAAKARGARAEEGKERGGKARRAR